ncbi:MAG: ribosome-binding factor A [Rickettsiales bacterium]|nr:ribosome-binding factor A [Rickettsiales bacterium]
MHKKTESLSRSSRIASKVQTLVGQILRDDFGEDPVISGISLVGAESHGGLRFVKLFYYNSHKDVKLTQKRLDEITRIVRFKLAQKIDQKYVPEIRFVYDDTLEKAARIDELLAKI